MIFCRMLIFGGLWFIRYFILSDQIKLLIGNERFMDAFSANIFMIK